MIKIRQLLASAVCSILLVAQTLSANNHVMNQLNANNDHGFWLELNADAKLSKNWLVKYHAEYRWGSNYRLFWYQEYEGVLQYQLKRFFSKCLGSILKNLSLGPGLNLHEILAKNTKGHFHWPLIRKALFDCYLDLEWNGWQLKQRMRGEYLAFNKKHYHDHPAYRHRLRLCTPIKLTSLNISPYISNEWFFRPNSYSKTHPTRLIGGYFQNRFRVGINIDVLKEILSSDIYWQWKREKQKPGTHPRWFNTYELGLALNGTF